MTASEKLADWWAATEPVLLRTSQRYAIGPEARRDLVQDVAVLALRRPSRWTTAEEFRRWALARLHWLMLDYVLAAPQQRMVPLGTDIHPTTPAEQEARVQALDLVSLIAQLPPRQAIVLSGLVAGLSVRELAIALRVSSATVRSLARFARQRLVMLIQRQEERE